MRKNKLLSAALLVMCCGSSINAQTTPSEMNVPDISVSTAVPKAWPVIPALLVVEGMVALNGLMAAEKPGLYGGTLTLISPLGVSPKLGPAGSVAAVTGILALGQYNFNYVSSRSDAKKRRFWVTVAGFHLLPLLAYGTDWLAGGHSREDNAKADRSAWRLHLNPSPEGGSLFLARRF